MLDRVTGLLWERKRRDNREHLYSWTAVAGKGSTGADCETAHCTVEEYVQLLNERALCGHRDWRVPRFQELISLVDYRRANPAALPGWFDDTVSRYYWSASREEDDNNLGTGFTFGFDYAYDRQSPGALRLVAGGEDTPTACRNWQQRFVRQPDGEILDRRSGKRWAPCPLGQDWRDNQCQGPIAVMDFNEAGTHQSADWRLPEIDELHSLQDPDCTDSGPAAKLNGHLLSGTPQVHARNRHWAMQLPGARAFTLDGETSGLLWLIRRR